MHRALAGIICILPLCSVACNAAVERPRHVIVSGSPAFAPLLHDLAARFEMKQPGAHVDLATSPIDRILTETRQGLVDVAIVGRDLRPDETGLRSTEVARDGIGFIVHRSNAVPSLYEAQLVGLLTRSYSAWGEVGGGGGPVVLYGVAENRALHESLVHRLNLTPVVFARDSPLR